MKSTQVSPRTLARIKAELKRRGITHAMVAAEATRTSRRGHVGTTMVSHVFADPPRAKSANVVAAARRLIEQAKAAGAGEGTAA